MCTRCHSVTIPSQSPFSSASTYYDTPHSPTIPLTVVLRLLGLRAGPLAIGAITVWIVRRPSRRAHSQALAAGAIGSALCAPASNPWILGTIVSAAAHSPTRCRIASATARNRRHVARIASSAARNPRLCSDCERAGSSRRRHQSPWERSCS